MALVIGSHYCPVEIARTKSWGIWVIYVGQVRSGVACEFHFSLSLSIFPGFGNLLRQNFRPPFPIEKHPVPVLRTCIHFVKKKGEERKISYTYICIDLDIDGFWMETAIDGRVDKKGRVPRLSIKECK